MSPSNLSHNKPVNTYSSTLPTAKNPISTFSKTDCIFRNYLFKLTFSTLAPNAKAYTDVNYYHNALTAFVSILVASSNLFVVGNASPTFKRQDSQSPQDRAVQYLQANGKIAWQQVGNGRCVDIPEDTYSSALTAVGADKNMTGTIGKRGTPNQGSINGYSVTKAACYHSGALASDNDITQYAVSACDALVGSALPPLAPKVLRIWQSAQSSDVNGLASYIRYGVKLLSPTTIADASLCQAAIDAFNNYCQSQNDDSRGGELTVGGVVTFSADPTDLDDNK